ncbi:hypothetical protein BHE74_00026628 [Ensete ventricosum]|nr:hypothetical protein BHE74_00026628 [Ensete ventricosum]
MESGLSSGQAQLVDLRSGKHEVQVEIGKVKGITFSGFSTVVPLVSDCCIVTSQVFEQLSVVVPSSPPRILGIFWRLHRRHRWLYRPYPDFSDSFEL